MNTFAKTSALAALLIPGIALAQINEGDALGTSQAEIEATLTAQGYVIEEVEIEADEIEIEARLGDQLFEFVISPETGLVTEVELEDEDEDDDDEDDA